MTFKIHDKNKCPFCGCREIYVHETKGEYVDYAPKDISIYHFNLDTRDAKGQMETFDDPDYIEDLPTVVICNNCGIVYKPKGE